MLDSSGVELQVVVVVGEEDTALRMGVGELNRVRGTEKPDLRSGRDTDAPPAEPLGNRRVHVFVTMEANRPWHPLP